MELKHWENKTIKYEGALKMIKYFGESTIYLENGNIHYEGTFLNGFNIWLCLVTWFDR